jgi:maltose alpha-D-glucosyltransferase/alpha-amylase
VLDVLEISGRGDDEAVWRFMIVQVDCLDGEPEVYAFPVVIASGRLEKELATDYPGSVIAVLTGTHPATVCEAIWGESFWRVLWEAIRGDRGLFGGQGSVQVVREPFADSVGGDVAGIINLLTGEQSNTSAVLGGRLVAKLFRQLGEGESPELEIGRILAEAGFQGAPRLAAGLNYTGPDGRLRTLVSAHEYIGNEGSGWTYTLDEIGRYLESIQLPADIPPGSAVLSVTDGRDLSSYLQSVELLGQRTGELHLLLARAPDAAFTPEPFSMLYQRNLDKWMRTEAKRTISLLASARKGLDETTNDLVERVLQSEIALLERYRLLVKHRIHAMRLRCHGDFHLGQVLFTGKEFVIIDFEGETARPVSERRIKASPLSDVAGMLRSFHYAACAALRLPRNEALRASAPGGILQESLERWRQLAGERFLTGYFSVANQGGFLPAEEEDRRAVLTAYVLHKAVYELRYELNNRPSWVWIPLKGIVSILQGGM